MLVWELKAVSYSYMCLLIKFHFPLIHVKTVGMEFILIFYIILLSNYYFFLCTFIKGYIFSSLVDKTVLKHILYYT